MVDDDPDVIFSGNGGDTKRSQMEVSAEELSYLERCGILGKKHDIGISNRTPGCLNFNEEYKPMHSHR